MRLKAQLLRPKLVTKETLSEQFYYRRGILRILDQSLFDYDNDGGCQSAAMFSAIEDKYRERISYAKMRECYLAADKFWNGKTEKLSRILRFMAVKGFDFGFGLIKVIDYSSIDLSTANYDILAEACRKYDFLGVSIRRNSPFFSSMTGKLYESIQIKGGHAMRVSIDNLQDRLLFINSGGKEWGYSGLGLVPRNKFGLLEFSEIRLCNFQKK